MEKRQGLDILPFATDKVWQRWLHDNHGTSPGLWLKLAKKNSGVTTVSDTQAREIALMYGWVDGLINAYDERYYLLRFMHRKPKSTWSKINRAKAEELIAAGKMQPAGQTQVNAAKQDGRWEAAYDSPANMEVPPDFQTELDKNPEAKAFFATISRANRYAILYRIHTAKQASTRARHIQKAVSMLEQGEVYHP